MKVSRVEEMRNLDNSAIKNFGITQELLMENAGQAAYFVMLKELGVRHRKFVVFCGTGNNGGDGFVVARKIHSMGGEAVVYVLGDVKNFHGAAKQNYEIVSMLPIEIRNIESLESLKSEILHCDVIVDAIFGTGLKRKVEELHKNVIQLINQSGKKILSIDIPSGINGNTGKVMGAAVRSDYTVSYGLPKIGNVLYPGFENCGKLYISHISFPPSLYNRDSIKVEVNIPVRFPERNRNAHKGDLGDVLFIAGARSYFGAPYFSAMSFLKAGGGYSRLAAPSSITPYIASKASEIVFVPQEETSSGSIALKNMDRLLELSELVDMVVMGPGLSLDDGTQELVKCLTKEIKKPLLIDGDGITAIVRTPEIVMERREPTVITPHLGEMSRITGLSVEEIDENKIDVLQKQAKKLNSIIVLKGAHSLTCYPDERIFINMSGNPGMATAGSGDMLTGAIAAVFGLGLLLEDAVRTGVFIHGLSGDLAASDKGEDGITAQDIMDFLPPAVKTYREEYDKIVKDFYNSIFII